mgnify:CR=1 FL=1
MTPQLKILTSMIAMSEKYQQDGKEYLTNDVNPFYKRTIEEVKDNLSFAKQCYQKVFLRFSATYFEEHGRLPPKELREFVL